MIRYQVIQKPIYVVCREVLEVRERGHDLIEGHYRNCLLDGDENTNGNFVVPVIEYDERLIQLGDYVRYDVRIDDFLVENIEELDKNPKLSRVEE